MNEKAHLSFLPEIEKPELVVFGAALESTFLDVRFQPLTYVSNGVPVTNFRCQSVFLVSFLDSSLQALPGMHIMIPQTGTCPCTVLWCCPAASTISEAACLPSSVCQAVPHGWLVWSHCVRPQNCQGASTRMSFGRVLYIPSSGGGPSSWNRRHGFSRTYRALRTSAGRHRL